MKIKFQSYLILSMIIMLFSLELVFSQVREYFVHNRGMLWETVYNTGVLGRPWANRGNEDGTVILPQFEWPGNAATWVEGLQYYGQHCSKGAGLWIIANPEDPAQWGRENRIFAFCGAVGSGTTPTDAIGLYSFPIEFQKIENYPILEDGTLNPSYDPGEAELVIVAKWATSTGITVTQTSRQWSYPDYDDFIIYEYTFEYTGDTDGDPATDEMPDINALTDVFISWDFCIAPSIYGYMRWYLEWKWKPGVHQGENWASFDSDYWLSFNSDAYTGPDDKSDHFLRAKPEPVPELFREFAETGKNGGGFCSPQAVGFSVLYYDTEHLAVIDTLNPNLNESAYIELVIADDLDDQNRVKQPWRVDREVGWNFPDHLEDGLKGAVNVDNNRGAQLWEDHPDPWWIGRDKPMANPKDANKAIARYVNFGPYKLSKGEKMDFTIAEVAGYGAEPGKEINGSHQDKTEWAPYPTLDKKVVLGGETMTENYLTDYGYPDYVNSEVKNVTQVAHKAFEFYLGMELEYSDVIAKNPMRPEENPKDGVYSLPVPPPSPVITVRNTATGEVNITWTTAAENFSHPNLTGSPVEFRIYRSYEYIGPWELLGTKSVGDVSEGIYKYLDDDDSFTIGSTGYYAVTAVDGNGIESGKPNIVKHTKNVGPAEKLTNVYVAPNPFRVVSGYPGTGEENMIQFFGLPEKCTIRIFSFAGQLVQTLEHDDPSYSETWVQVTRNQQQIASGVYVYVVTTPTGEEAKGKFVIIR